MTTHGEEFWRPLLGTGLNNIDSFFLLNSAFEDGIKRLIALLKMNDNDLILSTLSVLCNISTHQEVREAISTAEDDLSQMFAKLLKTNKDEIRSKTSILIADVCFIPSNQVIEHDCQYPSHFLSCLFKERFLQSDALSGLSNMLNSPFEDVLVNACNAIDLLCRNNVHMQNELAKYGIIEQLTELLVLDSSKSFSDTSIDSNCLFFFFFLQKFSVVQ